MFDVHFSVSPSGENNLALMPLMPAFLYTYTLCLALEPLYGLVFQCFITRKCDAHFRQQPQPMHLSVST